MKLNLKLIPKQQTKAENDTTEALTEPFIALDAKLSPLLQTTL